MQKQSIFIAAVIISITAVSIFFFPTIYQQNNNSSLHVTVTTSIIADAVTQIAGKHITVHTLMGPGIDPHSYHARLSDIRALLSSDIILYNGLHLEGKMASILEKMQTMKPTYAVANIIDQTKLIQSDEFDGIYDPHIWFDVTLWIEVIAYITDILIKHDQTNAKIYRHNYASYVTQLQKMHHRIQTKIKEIPKKDRFLVTTHDAFSYFGRIYDINVIALQGINLDAEPCITDIQQLVQVIVKNNIKTIFVESSLPHRSMQAISQAVHAYGWQVQIGDELYSDALGPQHSDAHTYIGMLKHNVNSVVNGLNSR
ncbi:MAG: zinc ABC transporter substrate-binding protein [Candidatus Dependentiae bacterium]